MANDDGTIPQRLGATIKAGRRVRRWSQEEPAQRLETSKNYVGQLERGERLPSLPMLAELAQALGFSTDAVILGGGDVASKHYAADVSALFASVAPEYRELALDFLRLVAQREPEASTGKSRPRAVRSRAP